MNSFLIGISTWISPEVSSPGQGALWESRPRFLSGTSLQRCHRSWPDVPMTSLAEAFGLGRGCFGREGVLRGTGTFPETGGVLAGIHIYVMPWHWIESITCVNPWPTNDANAWQDSVGKILCTCVNTGNQRFLLALSNLIFEYLSSFKKSWGFSSKC